MDPLLERLRKASTTKPPMVFVKYDRNVQQVQNRVFSVIDPTVAIIRCTPLPNEKYQV